MQTNTLALPTAPTVAAQGTTGATQWSYTIAACVGSVCTNTPTATQITNGNATLTTGNWNKVTWSAVTNADYYEVFRTQAAGTPSTTGGICLIPAGATLECDDKALTGDATSVPAYNATGQVFVGTGPKVGGGTGGGMFSTGGTAPTTLISTAAGWYANASNQFDIVNGTTDIGAGVAESAIISANVIPKAVGTTPQLSASSITDNGATIISTELFREGNACRITSAVTLTSGTPVTLCSWSLPATALTWSWQCRGIYSLTAGTTPTFKVEMNASQAPTSETGSANIYSTLTGTSTQATVTSTSAGNVLILTGATSATANEQFETFGTIQASATAGTFAITVDEGGSASPAGTVNVGTVCRLF